MYQPDHDDDIPSNSAEKWSVVIFILLILGLFIADIAVNFRPVKLSALFVVLFWIPLLGLHELAHAAMARSVGWQLERIVIGFGLVCWQFPILGSWVEVRQVPVGGYMMPRPNNLIFPRTKSFLIGFAGPAAGLLVSLAVGLLVGPEQLFAKSENYAMIACQSLAIAGAVQAFCNFFPLFFLRGSRTVPNDGMSMLLCFSRPIEYYAAMMSDEDLDRPDWKRSLDDDD